MYEQEEELGERSQKQGRREGLYSTRLVRSYSRNCRPVQIRATIIVELRVVVRN